MNKWLWVDRRDPDTQLVLTQPVTNALAVGKALSGAAATENAHLLRERCATLVGRKRKADESPTSCAPPPSELASSPAPSQPAGNMVHELHWTVLSGASEYFKRRVTTSLGSTSTSTLGSTPAFRHVFSEQLDEGQLEAAAAVLQTMYTQELAARTGTPESHTDHLLLMLQVLRSILEVATRSCRSDFHVYGKPNPALPPRSVN